MRGANQQRLMLAVALPRVAGVVIGLWLGPAAGFLAAVVGALITDAVLVTHTVREADRQRRAAEHTAAAGLRWLQALAQVSLSLSQPIDRNRFLRQITDALASLTSAHNVVLWELDAPAGLLVRRAWTADPSIGAMELPASLTLQQGGRAGSPATVSRSSWTTSHATSASWPRTGHSAAT
jgi:hypothetical protein